MAKKNSSPNPPGRPRAFNEEEALAAATRVFATKGYEGASLSDLTAAMGINRVSMYSTFGNKEALFRKAADQFAEAQGKTLGLCLAATTAHETVETWLRNGVKKLTGPDCPGVCFITQPPLTASDAGDETRRFVARKRRDVERGLKRRFEKAIREEELPHSASAEDLARYFAAMTQGLALLAQHGATTDQLLRVVDVAMAAWPKKV